ncbi:WD repeat-containing protein 49-like [Protopterus annectens]|uniref:WD repeat-containing protein 49-like n=1 Tax=Protopterus annectens TaxID=7888 RepID=UPI001CFAB2C9|nr:WD repeat-containing protein 49-like [Protopterus annectens]
MLQMAFKDESYTYMQLEYLQKDDVHGKTKDIIFDLPATIMETPHRDPILRITSTPDNTFLVVGQDGLLSFWTPDLRLKKTRSILDENKQSRKLKWIVDSTLMLQYNKLLIGTCDREIRFYELSNFEPYCQITGLETMPLRLEYSVTGKDDCIILYGDEQGCVNIFQISFVGQTLRNWSKCPMVEEIPTITIENITDNRYVKYIRWKVHNDWVTQVKYVHAIQSVISSSNNEDTALVIGCVKGSINLQKRLKEVTDGSSIRSKRAMPPGGTPSRRFSCDESIFKVYKGVKTFDFSKERNILVTGGMDRIIRLWNPYVPGWPIGLLRGHNSPISYLCIANGNSRIYSVSMDNAVMVWDIEAQSCLLSVISKASQIKGDLAACHFSHDLQSLCIATDNLALLQLRYKVAQSPNSSVSHNEPVLCCLYNKLLRQVFSCSEGSVIKVWDLETGLLVSEITEAHGDSAVTCMSLDSSCERLITGGRDGYLKKWNYSNGQLTQTLKQAAGSTDEVSDCISVQIHDKRYIISVGWNRRINIFPDLPDDVCETCYPQPHWNDDLNHGHKDDILSISHCPPNLLATSSYNGEVIVWNLISGHILCHLWSTTPSPPDANDDDLNICKVLFIPSRTEKKKTAASLVASGPKGCIHFWNVYEGGKLLGHFAGSRYKAVVCDLAISADDTILCAADQLGFVYLWAITEYAYHRQESDPPSLIHSWSAHQASVTSIELISELQLLVTSSTDCTVKLWSLQGEHVGTFGQAEPWNIKHRIALESKYSGGTVNTEGIAPQTLHMQTKEYSSDGKNTKKNASTNQEIPVPLSLKDDEIEQELKTHKEKLASRVQYEKPKQAEVHQAYGKLNAYQSLPLCDLVYVSPAIYKPNPAADLNDPYDLAF